MRIIGRHDVFLIGGLAIALWVVSSRQLGTLLDRAREIDHSRGLQLVPGLAILAVVFLIHQFRKRQEMRVEATQATSRVASRVLVVTGRGVFAIRWPDLSVELAECRNYRWRANGKLPKTDKQVRPVRAQNLPACA